MKEKHSVGKKFGCTFCKFTTARNCELGHHIKRSHKDEYDLLNAEDEETDSEKVDGQEVNIEEGSQEKENDDQDDDKEVEEIGILGRLQNQIRELRKRYDSLVPFELVQLSNLLEMREKAREAGLGEEVRDMLGSRGRKRAASPDTTNEPKRQSPRLLATQAEDSSQHGQVPERLLEAELLGERDERVDDDDAELAVESVLSELIELALEKEENKTMTGFRCTVCDKQFDRAWSVKVHMAAMHSVPEEEVLCTRKYCTRQFTTMFDMVVHRRLCIFKCGGCGKEIRRDDRVHSHMRKCSGGGKK